MTPGRATPVAVTVLLVVMTLAAPLHGRAQTRPPLSRLDAIDTIVNAFATHDVVVLTDPHRRVAMQTFLLALLRDARSVSALNDVVLEGASSRYQDVLDRYVRGDAIDRRMVQAVWQDTTQPQSLGIQTAELIDTIRDINRRLPAARRLRVIAGDPPIDWANITSRDDHFRWIELRESHPADLITRQIVERHRKALVIYGQMHAQRQQALTNYDMSAWQAQTLVSLLEATGVRAFTVWTLFSDRPLPATIAQWMPPAVGLLAGSDLGAEDFGTYALIPNRFSPRNGRLEPVPRQDWHPMPMERQFDAVLFLGGADTEESRVDAAFCSDPIRMAEQFARIARVGLPPSEREALEQACVSLRSSNGLSR